MNNALLDIRGLEKTFIKGGQRLTIFKDLNLQINSGEIVALVGPSGAGKSTLLQIAGLLDTPSAGSIAVNGKIIERLNDSERTRLRREHIGFVYQFHRLLPEFSALENVALPQIIAGVRGDRARERAADILSGLGLAGRLNHRPGLLSGGEQQRVAIARALANQPQLLFADEPTGNLDPQTSAEVFNTMLREVRGRGIGAFVATHNLELARQMDRVLELRDGRLVQV